MDCHTYAYLDVRVYALYDVYLDVCYLVTHNVCMRARLDLGNLVGIPHLDLDNPRLDCNHMRCRM